MSPHHLDIVLRDPSGLAPNHTVTIFYGASTEGLDELDGLAKKVSDTVHMFAKVAGNGTAYEARFFLEQNRNKFATANQSYMFVGDEPGQLYYDALSGGMLGNFIGEATNLGFKAGWVDPNGDFDPDAFETLMQKSGGGFAISQTETNYRANYSFVDVDGLSFADVKGSSWYRSGGPGNWFRALAHVIEVMAHELMHPAVSSNNFKRISFEAAPGALSANQRQALNFGPHEVALKIREGDYGLDGYSAEEIAVIAAVNDTIRSPFGVALRSVYAAGSDDESYLKPAQNLTLGLLRGYSRDLATEPSGMQNGMPDPHPGLIYSIDADGHLWARIIPDEFGAIAEPLYVREDRRESPNSDIPHRNPDLLYQDQGVSQWGLSQDDLVESLGPLEKIQGTEHMGHRSDEMDAKNWQMDGNGNKIEGSMKEKTTFSEFAAHLGYLMGRLTEEERDKAVENARERAQARREAKRKAAQDSAKSRKGDSGGSGGKGRTTDKSAPIVMDLDGDGVELLSAADGVSFDWDNDDFAEATGWAGADDGILIYDLPNLQAVSGLVTQGATIDGAGDGRIDQSWYEIELAGWAQDTKRATDYDGLKEFDFNGDGVVSREDEWDDNDNRSTIELEVRNAQGEYLDANGNVVEDKADAAKMKVQFDFDNLAVWQDRDSDGKIDGDRGAGDQVRKEYHSLDSLDIDWIGVQTKNEGVLELFNEDVATVKGLAKDGSWKDSAAEKLLQAGNTVDGFGQYGSWAGGEGPGAKSGRTEYQKDELTVAGTFADVVFQYLKNGFRIERAADGSFEIIWEDLTDSAQFVALDQTDFTDAGVDDAYNQAGIEALDAYEAKKWQELDEGVRAVALCTLEAKLLAEAPEGGTPRKPTQAELADIDNMKWTDGKTGDDIAEQQNKIRDGWKGLGYKIGTHAEANIENGGHTAVLETRQILGAKGTDARDFIDGTLTYRAGNGGVTLDGRGGEDWLLGGAGFDTLVGGDGDDVLRGGRGNDTLSGGEGADQLDGGAGHDTLVVDVEDFMALMEAGGTGITGGHGQDTLIIAQAPKVDLDDLEEEEQRQLFLDKMATISMMYGEAAEEFMTSLEGMDSTVKSGALESIEAFENAMLNGEESPGWGNISFDAQLAVYQAARDKNMTAGGSLEEALGALSNSKGIGFIGNAQTHTETSQLTITFEEIEKYIRQIGNPNPDNPHLSRITVKKAGRTGKGGISETQVAYDSYKNFDNLSDEDQAHLISVYNLFENDLEANYGEIRKAVKEDAPDPNDQVEREYIEGAIWADAQRGVLAKTLKKYRASGGRRVTKVLPKSITLSSTITTTINDDSVLFDGETAADFADIQHNAATTHRTTIAVTRRTGKGTTTTNETLSKTYAGMPLLKRDKNGNLVASGVEHATYVSGDGLETGPSQAVADSGVLSRPVAGSLDSDNSTLGSTMLDMDLLDVESMMATRGDDNIRGGDRWVVDELGEYIEDAGGDYIRQGFKVQAGGGDDRVITGFGADVIDGGTGSDILVSQGDNDQLSGGDGVDVLLAGQGHDVMGGGRDDGDFLAGGAGHDTYILGKLDGRDAIYDASGTEINPTVSGLNVWESDANSVIAGELALEFHVEDRLYGPDSDIAPGIDTIKLGAGIGIHDLRLSLENDAEEQSATGEHLRINVREYVFTDDVDAPTTTQIQSDSDDILFGAVEAGIRSEEESDLFFVYKLQLGSAHVESNRAFMSAAENLAFEALYGDDNTSVDAKYGLATNRIIAALALSELVEKYEPVFGSEKPIGSSMATDVINQLKSSSGDQSLSLDKMVDSLLQNPADSYYPIFDTVSLAAYEDEDMSEEDIRNALRFALKVQVPEDLPFADQQLADAVERMSMLSFTALKRLRDRTEHLAKDSSTNASNTDYIEYAGLLTALQEEHPSTWHSEFSDLIKEFTITVEQDASYSYYQDKDFELGDTVNPYDLAYADLMDSLSNFTLKGDKGDDPLFTGYDDDYVSHWLAWNEIKLMAQSHSEETSEVYPESGRYSTSFKVWNWSDQNRRIEQIEFFDGTLMDISDLSSTLAGTLASEKLTGTTGKDWINAGDGHDLIVGGGGEDIIAAGGGNDVIVGGADTEFAYAGAGDDFVAAGDGDDYLLGDAGDDTLIGGGGDDTLSGDAGDDKLYGGAGNDTLIGGEGDDTLYGGGGHDTYIYNRGGGHDTIHDSLGSVSYDAWTESSVLDGTYTPTVHSSFKGGDAGVDTLQFGKTISIESIWASLDGNNADIRLREFKVNDDGLPDYTSELDIENAEDRLTIRGWTNRDTRIETWAFGDGTILDMSGIESFQSGQDGKDEFEGFAGTGTVHGSVKATTKTENWTTYIKSITTSTYSIAAPSNPGTIRKETVIPAVGRRCAVGGPATDTSHINEALVQNQAQFDAEQQAIQAAIDEAAANDTEYDGPALGSVDEFNASQEALAQQLYAEANAASGGTGSVPTFFGPNSSLRASQGIIREVDDSALASAFQQETRIGDESTTSETDQSQWQIYKSDGTAHSAEITGYEVASQKLASLNDQATRISGNLYYLQSAKTGGDFLSGGLGDDVLTGNSGDDILIGGAGSDTLRGGDHDDQLLGGLGDDTLDGGKGDDYLVGGEGEDTLYGGNGKDVLTGGRGNDILKGGAGNDIYHWDAASGHDQIDEQPANASVNARAAQKTLSFVETYSEVTARTASQIVKSGKKTYTETNTYVHYQTYTMKSDNSRFLGASTVTQTTDADDQGVDTVQFGAGIKLNNLLIEKSNADAKIRLVGNDGSDPFYGIDVSQYSQLDLEQGDDEADADFKTRREEKLATAEYASWESARNEIMARAYDDYIELHREHFAYTPEGAVSDSTDAKDLENLGLKSKDDFDEDFMDALQLHDSWVNSAATLTIKNWGVKQFRMDEFRFADGLALNVSNIIDVKSGTSEDDNLNADNQLNTWLSGFAGEDTLQGSREADILIGGTDDDLLMGGSGNDTYVFEVGSGKDTIEDTSSVDSLYSDRRLKVLHATEVQKTSGGKGGTTTRVNVEARDTEMKDKTLHGYQQSTVSKGDAILFGNGISIEDLRLEKNGTALNVGVMTVEQALKHLMENHDLAWAYRFEKMFHGEARTLSELEGLDAKTFSEYYQADAELRALNDSDFVEQVYNLATNEVADDAILAKYSEMLKSVTRESVFMEIMNSDLAMATWAPEVLDVLSTDDEYFFDRYRSELDYSVWEDQITIKDYFGTGRIETFSFADGTDFGFHGLQDAVLGTAGEDSVDFARNGVPVNLTVTGAAWIDVGFGDDNVYAKGGDNFIELGHGNDFGHGHLGDDIINGGQGDDIIWGDHHLYENGNFTNLIAEFESEIVEPLAQNDDLTTEGISKILTAANSSSLAISNHHAHNTWKNSFNDTLLGGDGQDLLIGGLGSDSLFGGAGFDVIIGGQGADSISGGAGDDIINSGHGQDTISWGRGEGDDVLIDYRGGTWNLAKDAKEANSYRTESSPDIIHINGVDRDELWFRRVGNDIVINILGTDDSLTVKDLYRDLVTSQSLAQNLADPGQRFVWGGNITDGGGGIAVGDEYLQYKDVNALVQAMSSWQPSFGTSVLGTQLDSLPFDVQSANDQYWRPVEQRRTTSISPYNPN